MDHTGNLSESPTYVNLPNVISKTTSKLLGTPATWNPKGGAPKGNRNALKHGNHTAKARKYRQAMRTHLAVSHALVRLTWEAIHSGTSPDVDTMRKLRRLANDARTPDPLEPLA